MNAQSYDAIVVGARCAGSPAAMLLARKGHRVLLVDRATFPSDTLSTHVVQPQAVARLARWGLLDRLVASGCPPIDTYAFAFGPMQIAGSPGTEDAPVAYCPRRLVLDEILVRAAVEAGAELREGFVVDEVTMDGGRVTGIRGHDKSSGESLVATAPIVIGADGRSSVLAKAARAEAYDERAALQGGYYGYWSGVDVRGRFEIHIGEGCGAGIAETHDGLAMMVGGWPIADYEGARHDHVTSYVGLLDRLPSLGERMRGAKLQSRVLGGATPNFFRKPYGPGWALVGDAGYCKDPITAQGIADAFRDADAVAEAVHAWRSGARTWDEVMAEVHATRDAESRPMYDFTCKLAALQPPPPEEVQLLGAVSKSQDAMDRFCRVNAGNLSPAEFFAPESVGRIFAAAQG